MPPDLGVVDPNEPPPIPVGYDALRLWDHWPSLRIGMRTHLWSTFDRLGGNDAADAAHFIRQRSDGFYVPLDLVGQGTLSFVRTNHWHGSPWHYVVDGVDTVVRESSTATPDHPVPSSTFLPAELFPPPLAYTWSTTKGADLSWVSIPFRDSLQLVYERGFYGTGYFIVQQWTEGTARLSHPLETWDRTPPPADVLALLSRAGQDLAPAGLPVLTGTTSLELAGPRTLRRLKITAPAARAVDLGRGTLRVRFDGRDSVDAPVALFFGAGTLYRRTDAEWLVKSFPSTVRFTGDRVELTSLFPMPFFEGAKITVETDVPDVHLEVAHEENRAPKSHVGTFHATFRDHGAPIKGQDLVLLDTRGIEGSPEWCGHVVGTSFQFSDNAVLWTLEGDPRFFFDDSETPQVQGTGTEEWGGGGDYWGGENMTLPFAGHPVGAPAGKPLGPEDAIESAYRFLLLDLMPFGRNARVQLEHGGADDSDEHYRSVAFWYGAPGACLTPADSLQIGDLTDEAKHAYVSPAASAPESLESAFELGAVAPTSTMTGRHGTGPSDFTLSIPARNFGVLLRRTFDLQWVDQRADVFVAEDRDGAPYEKAGTFFHAGSNVSVFGATKLTSETTNGPSELQTSSRRFREQELLVPRKLTEGRSRIRVRIVPTSAPLPVRPGEPTPTKMWSELRYRAYAWVLPPG